MNYPWIHWATQIQHSSPHLNIISRLPSPSAKVKKENPVLYKGATVSEVQKELEAVGARLNKREEGMYLRGRMEGRFHPIEHVEELEGLFGQSENPIKLKITKGGTPEVTGGNNPKIEAVEHAPNTILSALSSFISAYGIRALEVIGGAALILFGLMTIAKKGDMKMPSAVPVPV